MSSQEIVIEKIWSNPPEIHVHFLQKCRINLQIRNKSSRPIRIDRIECLFQVEPEFPPFVSTVECYEVLQPNWLSSVIGIDFEADLALKSMTNTYGIKVSYFDNDNRVIVPDRHPYIVFNPLGQNNPHLFISHKDPEDTAPCRRLRDFLKKVGFEGYLSEDDHRPGVDLWTGKIPSAIEGSRGVVILWTERAASVLNLKFATRFRHSGASRNPVRFQLSGCRFSPA